MIELRLSLSQDDFSALLDGEELVVRVPASVAADAKVVLRCDPATVEMYQEHLQKTMLALLPVAGTTQ